MSEQQYPRVWTLTKTSSVSEEEAYRESIEADGPELPIGEDLKVVEHGAYQELLVKMAHREYLVKTALQERDRYKAMFNKCVEQRDTLLAGLAVNGFKSAYSFRADFTEELMDIMKGNYEKS